MMTVQIPISLLKHVEYCRYTIVLNKCTEISFRSPVICPVFLFKMSCKCPVFFGLCWDHCLMLYHIHLWSVSYQFTARNRCIGIGWKWRTRFNIECSQTANDNGYSSEIELTKWFRLSVITSWMSEVLLLFRTMHLRIWKYAHTMQNMYIRLRNTSFI